MANPIELPPDKQADFDNATLEGLLQAHAVRAPDLLAARPYCVHEQIDAEQVSGTIRFVGDSWVVEVKYQFTFADSVWRITSAERDYR